MPQNKTQRRFKVLKIHQQEPGQLGPKETREVKIQETFDPEDSTYGKQAEKNRFSHKPFM